LGAFRSIGILAVLNALGAVTSVANTILIGYFFGTLRAVEIYFAANTLQGVVNQLTQSGQISELFVPLYHRRKESGGKEAAELCFAVILNWTFLLVLAVVLLAMLAAPWLMAITVPGFSAEDQAFGVQMFRWLIPVAIFNVTLALMTALANAESRFGQPEAWMLMGRVASVAAILILATHFGVWALVWSWWATMGVSLIGLIAMLRRMGYRHRFALRVPDYPVASFFGRLLSTLGDVVVAQLFNIVLTAGLSTLPQGSLAVFRYARLIHERTTGIALRPVFTVFFTQVSQAIAGGSEKVRALVVAALNRSLAVVALLVAGMAVAAVWLLGGLLGGDRFPPDDIRMVATLLVIFFVLLAARGQSLIGRKTVMALGMVHRVTWITVLSRLLACGCAWLFIAWWGMTGAVITIVCMELLLALAPSVVLLVWSRAYAATFSAWLVLRWSIAVLCGCGATLWLESFLPELADSGRAARIGAGTSLAMLGVGTALAAAWVLKVYEVRESVRRVGARLTRHLRAAS